MRLASIVEYEGTKYSGFQYQINAPSIQEELEKAIYRLTGETVRVKAAGRTDAGVHARGQVIAFDACATHSTETFVRAINFYLPGEISLREAYRTPPGFDPRRDACSRRYRYSILNSATPSPLLRRTAYLLEHQLDVGKMQEAARLLVGRHDFRRFSGAMSHDGASTVREIYSASVSRSREMVSFDVVGSSFLPHQVRRMAGVLVDVGRDRLSLEELKRMVDGGAGERVAHSLPAHGLCLMEVTYADFPPADGESN